MSLQENMTTEEQKSELLEDFQRYLQQSQLDQATVSEQPDLSTLLAEMASLKTEVKAESRQFKATLETLNSALVAVQDDNKTLTTELAHHAEQLEQQKSEIIRAVLLDVVDIYDRLSTGLVVLNNYKPVRSVLKKSRDKDIHFIERFKEGQAMTARRFEQLLQRYQVREIQCVGQLFDPLTMSAVETTQNPKFENGRVVEELRKGFLIQNQVLRLAEVKVNKINLQ